MMSISEGVRPAGAAESPLGKPIDAGVRIGHVHLKVADIERALAFYCGVLGFQLKQRYGDRPPSSAAGDYHHHIGLNTWESKGGSPPPRGDRPACSITRSSIRRAPRWPMRFAV